MGHGLGYFYNITGIPAALDVCESQEDMQFQYACATGVFMSLEKFFPAKTFEPCDTNKYPAACYRFKNRLFNTIFYDTPNPCDTQSDINLKLGCIWGFAYVRKPLSSVHEFCKPFEPEYKGQEPQSSFSCSVC